MVLVVGARGALGSRVVRRLLAEGRAVRAVSRDPAGLASLTALGAEAVAGDLLDEAWHGAALAGVEQVVMASHGLVPPSTRNHPGAVDGDGARRFIDAAGRAGVRHVVYVSAAGADRASDPFGRVKFATEQHLRASGVPCTVVRPTVFVENNGLMLLGEPARAGKPVQIVGAGTEPVNWVSAEDVADEVVRALAGGAVGQVLEVRGPDTLTRLEVLEIVERALGATAKRQHLPRPVAQAVRALVGPFHPGIRYLLGLVLSEGAPSQPSDGAVVRVGRTPVAEVVERWAAVA